MIIQLREKKETGFSLLELSVAVGVAAIVATAGIVASTAFIGSAQDKRDSYTDRANASIEEAESSSIALGMAPLIAAPSGLQAASVSDTSATLNWTTPNTREPITSYTILVDGDAVATLDGDATSYTITGLQPSTSYDVIVRATNANGSENSTFTLNTAMPGIAAPTSIQVATSTSGAAGVSWTAPASEPVDDYVISLDGTELATVDGGTTSYNITGLTSPNRYLASVKAVNSNGEEEALIALYPEDENPEVTADSKSTSSILWDSGDADTAIWTGGHSRDYSSDELGWTKAPFSSIGELGLARTMPEEPSDRRIFEAFNKEVSAEQGGIHQMELYNVLRMNTFRHIDTNVTITAQGNSIRYTIDLSDHYPQSLPGNRLFWKADMAAGNNAEYVTPDANSANTIIVKDSTNTHSLAVIHIDTDHGTASFGGSELYTDPVTNGNSEIAAYVTDITSAPVQAKITSFIIDYDACGADLAMAKAQEVAADPASFVGQEIPVQKGCSPEAVKAYYN